MCDIIIREWDQKAPLFALGGSTPGRLEGRPWAFVIWSCQTCSQRRPSSLNFGAYFKEPKARSGCRLTGRLSLNVLPTDCLLYVLSTIQV